MLCRISKSKEQLYFFSIRFRHLNIKENNNKRNIQTQMYLHLKVAFHLYIGLFTSVASLIYAIFV